MLSQIGCDCFTLSTGDLNTAITTYQVASMADEEGGETVDSQGHQRNAHVSAEASFKGRDTASAPPQLP